MNKRLLFTVFSTFVHCFYFCSLFLLFHHTPHAGKIGKFQAAIQASCGSPGLIPSGECDFSSIPSGDPSFCANLNSRTEFPNFLILIKAYKKLKVK